MSGYVVTIGRGYLPYLAPPGVEIPHEEGGSMVFVRGLPRGLPLTGAAVDRRGGLVLEFGGGGEQVAIVGKVCEGKLRSAYRITFTCRDCRDFPFVEGPEFPTRSSAEKAFARYGTGACPCGGTGDKRDVVLVMTRRPPGIVASVNVVESRERSRAMDVCSYAATALLTNQPGWMEGLAERINRYLDVIGDESRVEFDGERLGIEPAEEVAT